MADEDKPVRSSRDTLWTALSSSLGSDAGDWIVQNRAEGASWRDLETFAAQVGVPVSYEYLRTQAKTRGYETTNDAKDADHA